MLGRGEVHKKGIDTAFRAMALLRGQFPTLHFNFYGDDAESGPRLRELAIECGVSDRVSFRGMVHGAAVAEAFRAMDGYLMCSRYEGGPITLLEAMASGLPTVATRVGLAEELIQDGVEGYLVDAVGDPDALAAGIRRLVTASAASHVAMGAAARDRIVRGYSVERMCAELRAVLSRTLSC